jgi:hypothetical protein
MMRTVTPSTSSSIVSSTLESFHRPGSLILIPTDQKEEEE